MRDAPDDLKLLLRKVETLDFMIAGVDDGLSRRIGSQAL